MVSFPPAGGPAQWHLMPEPSPCLFPRSHFWVPFEAITKRIAAKCQMAGGGQQRSGAGRVAWGERIPRCLAAARNSPRLSRLPWLRSGPPAAGVGGEATTIHALPARCFAGTPRRPGPAPPPPRSGKSSLTSGYSSSMLNLFWWQNVVFNGIPHPTLLLGVCHQSGFAMPLLQSMGLC